MRFPTNYDEATCARFLTRLGWTLSPPTQPLTFEDRLMAAVVYDPNAGTFTYRPRQMGAGYDARAVKSFNKQYAGKPAFCTQGKDGRPLTGCFEYRKLSAHRVAWFLAHGRWPEGEIDHINGDRTDNRLANLRECTGPQNKCNVPRRSHSKSPYKGIRRQTRGRGWMAKITSGGKERYLGTFPTAELAAEAYDLAAIVAHGQFARLNFPERLRGANA